MSTHILSVKGFDKNDNQVSVGGDHFFHDLNNTGHWNVADRIAITVCKHKRVKTVKYFFNGKQVKYGQDLSALAI